MKNTLKTLMIVGGLLQGSAAFSVAIELHAGGREFKLESSICDHNGEILKTPAVAKCNVAELTDFKVSIIDPKFAKVNADPCIIGWDGSQPTTSGASICGLFPLQSQTNNGVLSIMVGGQP